MRGLMCGLTCGWMMGGGCGLIGLRCEWNMGELTPHRDEILDESEDENLHVQ